MIGDFLPISLFTTPYHTARGLCRSDLAPIFEDVQARGNKAQRFKGGRRVKYQKIRWLPLLDAVPILHAKDYGCVPGDQIEHVVDLLVAAHMT